MLFRPTKWAAYRNSLFCISLAALQWGAGFGGSRHPVQERRDAEAAAPPTPTSHLPTPSDCRRCTCPFCPSFHRWIFKVTVTTTRLLPNAFKSGLGSYQQWGHFFALVKITSNLSVACLQHGCLWLSALWNLLLMFPSFLDSQQLYYSSSDFLIRFLSLDFYQFLSLSFHKNTGDS